jgi:hypothetical protein
VYRADSESRIVFDNFIRDERDQLAQRHLLLPIFFPLQEGLERISEFHQATGIFQTIDSQLGLDGGELQKIYLR